MTRHMPVLLNEVLGFLPPNASKIVDGTIGDAGHAQMMLKQNPLAKLIGLDADPEGILRAKNFLHEFQDRIHLERESFANLDKTLAAEGWDSADFILLDLGWSSSQLEESGRGFSFQKPDEPLDMRLNPQEGETAAEILNSRSAEELGGIIRMFGEEKEWRNITNEIIRRRKEKKFEIVDDLLKVIDAVLKRKSKIHPATKTFQALRIAVNNELQALMAGLEKSVNVLKVGGRVAVITFHSLEDRIVKNFFNKLKDGDKYKILTQKPIKPTRKEIKENHRARSAKLRVIERKL